jgi:4a-hydroxytetrahydrobiopterin dehydratase
MVDPLSPHALQSILADLAGWTHEDNAFVKTFTARSFEAAIAFIVQVGFEAARADHHPELFNVYATVRVRLTTHDAGNRVTQRDADLARAIESLSPAFCLPSS